MFDISHPIELFSVTHFLLLGAFMLVPIFFAIVVSKKFGFTKNVVWICFIVGILCEIERHIFFVVETDYGFRLLSERLPFNLCPFQLTLLLILVSYKDIRKCKKMISFMFPMMIGGGFMGMLLPAEAFSFNGLTDFGTYRYYFYHGLLVFLGLYFYLSKAINFDLKSYGYAIFFGVLVVFGGVYINAFFPYSNHMFVTRPPTDGLPILNLNRGWAGYIFDLAFVGTFLVSLCYLPVIIREVPVLVAKIKGRFKSNRRSENE